MVDCDGAQSFKLYLGFPRTGWSGQPATFELIAVRERMAR